MYCPADPVKRDQMAAFLLRGLGEFNPPTPPSQRFSDVPPSNVFYNFIDRLAVLQITLGCTPDHLMYCPGFSNTSADGGFLSQSLQSIEAVGSGSRSGSTTYCPLPTTHCPLLSC
jgi:hypothetical protein